MPRRSMLLLSVVVSTVLIAGCGGVADDDPAGDGSGSEPITSRAVAAVALTHLPDDTASREATYVSYESAPGTRGADLRYRAGEGDDGDLVRVEVFPRDELHPPPTCATSAAQTCVESDVDGGVEQLRWEVLAPEEDPGLVSVTMIRDDEIVRSLYAGPPITGDPRALDLDVSVDTLTELVTDPRISLRTDEAVIAAGESLDRWQGRETPDTADPTPIPATGRALAGFFAQYAGVPYFDVPTSADDVADLFGPGAVAGRLTRLSYGEDPRYEEVEVVASPQPPATAAGGDPCSAYERTDPTARCRDAGSGEYLFWTPGRRGEVWAYAQRSDEVVAFRFTSFVVPSTAPAAAGAVDFDRMREMLRDETRLGLTTTQGMANVQF